MSPESLLPLLVSILAVIISAVSLYRTRKTEARQLELQATQAKLAEFQHNILTVEQLAARQADLRLELVREGRQAHFVFSNRGPAIARNVGFAFFSGGAPVISKQFNEVFPIPQFLPGEAHRLIAAITLDTPPVLEGEYSWVSIDGNAETRRCKVVL